MSKFYASLLVFFCGVVFSQTPVLSFQTVHRLHFDLKGEDVAYSTNFPEVSTFSFYFNRDTSQVSFFLHTTPELASKYYLIGTPTITDSTLDLYVKSDAGNVYFYRFKPKTGFIYAKNINKDLSSTFLVMFIVPDPKSVDFSRIYR